MTSYTVVHYIKFKKDKNITRSVTVNALSASHVTRNEIILSISLLEKL